MFSDERSWVQCDLCQQWRDLPGCTREEYEVVQALESWTCSLNRWDPARASCVQPEETVHDAPDEILRGSSDCRSESGAVVVRRKTVINGEKQPIKKNSQRPGDMRRGSPGEHKKGRTEEPSNAFLTTTSVKTGRKEKDEENEGAKDGEDSPGGLGGSRLRPRKSKEPPDPRGVFYPARRRRVLRASKPRRSGQQRLLPKVKTSLKEENSEESKPLVPDAASESGGSSGGDATARNKRPSDSELLAGSKRQKQDRHLAGGSVVPPEQIAKLAPQTIHWVQCDVCQKWRSLPGCSREEYEELNSSEAPWTCSQNKWDTARSYCDAPEETTLQSMEADAFDSAFTRLLASAFRRFVQQSGGHAGSEPVNLANRPVNLAHGPEKSAVEPDVISQFPLKNFPWHQLPPVVLESLYAKLLSLPCQSVSQESWDFTRVLLVHHFALEVPKFRESLGSFAACCARALTDQISEQAGPALAPSAGIVSFLKSLVSGASRDGQPTGQDGQPAGHKGQPVGQDGQPAGQDEHPVPAVVPIFELSELLESLSGLSAKNDCCSSADVEAILKFLNLLEKIRRCSSVEAVLGDSRCVEDPCDAFVDEKDSAPSPPVTLFRLTPPVLSLHPLASRVVLRGGFNVSQIVTVETLPRILSLHPSLPCFKLTKPANPASGPVRPAKTQSATSPSGSSATGSSIAMVGQLMTMSVPPTEVLRHPSVPTGQVPRQPSGPKPPETPPDSYHLHLASALPWPGIEDLSDASTWPSSSESDEKPMQCEAVIQGLRNRRATERWTEQWVSPESRERLVHVTRRLLNPEHFHRLQIDRADDAADSEATSVDLKTVLSRSFCRRWIRFHQGNLRFALLSSGPATRQSRRDDLESRSRPTESVRNRSTRTSADALSDSQLAGVRRGSRDWSAGQCVLNGPMFRQSRNIPNDRKRRRRKGAAEPETVRMLSRIEALAAQFLGRSPSGNSGWNDRLSVSTSIESLLRAHDELPNLFISCLGKFLSLCSSAFAFLHFALFEL